MNPFFQLYLLRLTILQNRRFVMTTLFESDITYDFDDGLGPVPAYRHPNGGGWVSETAQVEKTATVGPQARVHGYAVIRDFAVINERADVSGYCVVKDYATIRGNSVVKGTCEISGKAVIAGEVFLSGHIRIGGNTVLEGKGAYFSEVDCLVCPALLDENYLSTHENPCLDCLEKQKLATKERNFRSRRVPVWARLKKKRSEGNKVGDKA
jgi:carbonic anhydrase/acetyltransferase-like protein (isoleucine patch superfamily)